MMIALYFLIALAPVCDSAHQYNSIDYWTDGTSMTSGGVTTVTWDSDGSSVTDANLVSKIVAKIYLINQVTFGF
jgi:hypothetical protein